MPTVILEAPDLVGAVEIRRQRDREAELGQKLGSWPCQLPSSEKTVGKWPLAAANSRESIADVDWRVLRHVNRYAFESPFASRAISVARGRRAGTVGSAI